MKQKSYKQLKINEYFYNKKHNIESNSKIKKAKLNNSKSAINNINIINKPATDNVNKSNSNSNSIKNLSLKTKIIKILSVKGKGINRNQKIRNKNKNYKKLTYTKGKSEMSEISKDNQIEFYLGEQITNNGFKEKEFNIQSYKGLNKENINSSGMRIPIECEKNEEKMEIYQKSGNLKKKSINKLISEKENEMVNNSINKTTNELDYKKMEKNCVNLKNKKGTFSFNSFLKKQNGSENKETDNEIDSDRDFFDNRFKERKISFKKIENLKMQNENSVNSTVNEFKNKNSNNIILLNFRSDKRKRFFRENRISTSSEKEISAKNGALKILEFLRNKKSEKIILKQNEKELKEKVNNKICEVNNDILIKSNKGKIDHDESDNKGNNIIFSNNNDIRKDDFEYRYNYNYKYGLKNEKENRSEKSIFNEIIEEVKQEKNYIQKIVHRKLIQGANELKKNKSCNKFCNNEKRLNTETFNEVSLKTIRNPNSVFYNIFSDKRKNEDNILNINLDRNIESEEKQNNRYLSLNLDEFKNIKRSYEKSKTYNNYNSSSSYSNDNININLTEKMKNANYGGVKVKKIRLDKLKDRIQRNKLIYNKGDNININLNLNNKIINIHNSQKIYMPKKASITKKQSYEMMSIPIFYSKSSAIKNNSFTPSIYSKNEETCNSSYMNNIKPFNEINLFDLDNTKKKDSEENSLNINKINNNINSVIITNNNNNTVNDFNKNIKNINLNTNYNKTKNVKQILYSKAKIKRISDTSFTKNLSTNRCKTIRYIKKSKNKIERLETKQMKQIDDTNKIMKIQEIQLGGLTKKNSEKTFSNLDRTQPINFNLKSPSLKQNSFIKYRTFLSSEINDIPNFNLKESKKQNQNDMNLSQLYPSNGEDKDDTLSTKKFNTGIAKLGYNFSYDKIMNNITGTDDIINENNDIKLEQILNMLSFEDLLILEDKFNLVLIVLEKGNKTYEEYFDLWNYFFSSMLKSKLEQIFKYFLKETENMKAFINYSLIFLMICYDFAANSISVDIDNNFSLIEICQIIYTNLLFIINLIKSRISFDNKDNYNIRLIELSKIEVTIKNKLSNVDNDFLFVKEILHCNTNTIIKKVTEVIDSNALKKISNQKNYSELFSKIKISTLEDFNNFFLENVLKEEFIGCSVLATTYLKEKQNISPALVPYLRAPSRKNYSLVLDLDETLIHFKVNNDENEEGVLKLRPGVFTFLENVKEYYEIILFTEASEAYTKLMMEAFSNNNNRNFFDFKLFRQHTIIIGQDFIKDLSRIGRPLDKIIIIDNIPQNFKMQKGNGILIKPFLGEDQNDQALIDLIPILTNIARDEIDTRNGLLKYRDEILTKISSNLFRRNKHK